MKRIIITGLIILLSVGNGIACDTHGRTLHLEPNNVLEYPNTGWIYVHSCFQDNPTYQYIPVTIYATGGNTIYVDYSGYAFSYYNQTDSPPCSTTFGGHQCGLYDGGFHWAFNTMVYETTHTSGSASLITTGAGYSNRIVLKGEATMDAGGQCWDDISSMNAIYYISLVDKYLFNATGDICGIEWVQQYIWDGSSYLELANSTNVNAYSFEIGNQSQYKLKFSDGHEYIFTCDGTDIEYDRDICQYFTINFLDNCANYLIDPHVDIYKKYDIPAETELIYSGNESSVALLLGTDCDIDDRIDVYIDTIDGMVHKVTYADEIDDNLFHDSISWELNIHVVDETTGYDIPNAHVTREQTCTIELPLYGYALTQSDGRVVFTGLSNTPIDITVSKDGYTGSEGYVKTLDPQNVFNCWSHGGGYTVFLNATSEEEFDNWNNTTSWGCDVWFENVNGIKTSIINNTDTYVDMYYGFRSLDCTHSTLKFQHQLYTNWYTDEEYTITNDTYGYYRIMNNNFSDYINAYRGYIYNTSCKCNAIQKLIVINQTYEDETHYENLTSHCHIMHKLSGNEIDYRSDIAIRIYANSSNSTLLDITAYLMNGTEMIDSKIMNWADFVSGSLKWWYVWYPDYDYTSGFNYTINITGYNGYQLDTDEVWTADIIGNTLTVYIKDNHGVCVSHATVFVENWGSQATGASTYVTISGLPDGDTQYKATKSGYTSSVWDTITLAGEDESVTCVLIKESMASVTGFKMKDNEIKAFFIPLIYLLLILIIIGGVTNASKK